MGQSYDLVITRGVCATASDVAPLDIAIKDEKVVLLAPSGTLAQAKATKTIDAKGAYVTVSSDTQATLHGPRLMRRTAWGCGLPCSSSRASHVW